MSKSSEKVINWRKRTKTKIVKAMGGKCQCCGYDKCEDALELHHIDPFQKDFGMGKMRANPRALIIIIEELKKCIMVCSNCHKEIHAGIRELPTNYFILDENILISERELRNKVISDNRKENLAIGRTMTRDMSGKNNPMFGKKVSEETKRKISESLKRRKLMKR